jgi:hypothetical protein
MIAFALTYDWWMGLPVEVESDWHDDEWHPSLGYCVRCFMTGVLIGMILG